MDTQACARSTLLALTTAAFFAGNTAVATPLPSGWTCFNTNGEQCGTIGANGDIPLSPLGGALFGGQHGYVITRGEAVGINYGLGLGDEANGGVARSPVFTANVGDKLEYYFNFVSSDGEDEFIEVLDYAWVRLLDSAMSPVAMLFTARVYTDPKQNTVPGWGMPSLASGASLSPTTSVVDPKVTWSPLGTDSGKCGGAGCGNTGWIAMDYTFTKAGDYILGFGVSNWSDNIGDSGLAFDGTLVPVPEPETYAMMLAGLGLLTWVAHRRQIRL
mgnify:CR=1 FL=1